LQASETPVARRQGPGAARTMAVEAQHFDEAAFRYALNDDAMATDKLAEGIRAFAADGAKLDRMIEGMRQ
jgi:transaldolase